MTDAFEERALAVAADRLALTIGEEVLDGGSPARVYRATDRQGTALALKVLVARPGAVDGHDLASFRGKLRQLDEIRLGAPRLAARCLPILASVDANDFAAYTTPWFPSEDLAACLRVPGTSAQDSAAVFFATLSGVIDILVLGGYAVSRAPTPPDHLAVVNIGRFLRRWSVLERSLPPQLLAADKLRINGVACNPPQAVLARLLAEHGPRLARMTPAYLMFPAHGDANTRNILVHRADDGAVHIRLIDPRGSVAPWDPVYDLAKILFSLTVWDPALRRGFAVLAAPSQHGKVEVTFQDGSYPGYQAAIRSFIPRLAMSPGLSDLFAADPCWRDRLLLTHAMHVLSEAPCRLSDHKLKLNHRGEVCSSASLALGHYLLGTLLINNLAARLARPGELDAQAHLALVSEHLPRD